MSNKYLEGVSVVAQGARQQAVKIVNLNLANISNLLIIYHSLCLGDECRNLCTL